MTRRKAAAFELSQGGEHPRHESNLVQGVNLVVGWLLDERAVTVDEQDARAHRSAASRRLFCSGEPTVIRRQPVQSR